MRLRGVLLAGSIILVGVLIVLLVEHITRSTTGTAASGAATGFQLCTLGKTDANVTLQFSGDNAGTLCQDAMKNDASWLVSPRNVIPDGATIVCTYNSPTSNDTLTIYDTGFQMLGSAACSNLSRFSQWVPAPTVGPPTPAAVPTPTAVPVAIPTDTPVPQGSAGDAVIAAVKSYHAAAQAAYGASHDYSQVDATTTGTARAAILCVMRGRSDSLINTNAYFTYRDLSDMFDAPNVVGDNATVVEHKHQILTVHHSDGSTSPEDNTFDATYTLVNQGGAWLVSDYSYVTSTGSTGSAADDAKACPG